MTLLSPPQQRAAGVAVPVIALAAGVALLYYGRDFFVTLIVSAIFAFILDPVVDLVTRLRAPRSLATGIVIVIALAGVYVVGATVWTQLANAAEDLPAYTAHIGDLWQRANDRLDAIEKQSVDMLVPQSLRQPAEQTAQKTNEARTRRRRGPATAVAVTPPAPPAIQEVRIHTDPRPFIATLYGYLSGYFHVLVMASFVPFLVYFMLSWRDRIGHSVLRIFEGEQRGLVAKAWLNVGDSTRGYVLGNFFLWLFLGSISAVAFFFLGVPYWAIAGPFSAFLSLMPYVGLPLAAVPPVLALLAMPVELRVVLTVVLITAGLHVIAMNFLYAKVIGPRVRLNPLAVTVALMFWGVIWGGAGLVLAVPITAAIKAACDNIASLKPYGRLLGD